MWPALFNSIIAAGMKLLFSVTTAFWNSRSLSVTAPDGMILYTYGPTDKVHNDNWLLRACGMNSDMLPEMEVILGERYGIYGDPIFGRTDYVSRSFPRALATADQLDFNVRMNAARVSIENVFGCVVNLWTLLDFKRYFKIHQNSPARTYLNAQFLTNCHNCMRPNQVAQMFDCQPPTLTEYLDLEEFAGAWQPAITLYDDEDEIEENV